MCWEERGALNLLNALMQALSEERDIDSIAAGVKSGLKEQLVSGLSGSSRQVMMAALAHKLERPVLIVTHNMFSAQKAMEDLQECLSQEQVVLYPANELVAAEAAISSPEVVAQRIDALTRLAKGFRGVVVTPYAGLRRYLPSRDVMADAELQLKVDDEFPLEAFLWWR